MENSFTYQPNGRSPRHKRNSPAPGSGSSGRESAPSELEFKSEPTHVGCYDSEVHLVSPIAAFTLTELLVVIAVLALLAMTQLPALTKANAPVTQTLCANNLRQIGQAVHLYLADNRDEFPFGGRCTGEGSNPTPGSGAVDDPTCWPMQLLRYLGNSTNQPAVYRCPEVIEDKAPTTLFRLDYLCNRHILADYGDGSSPTLGRQIKNPSLYLVLMERRAATPTMPAGQQANIRPGAFNGGGILAGWNTHPGYPEFRRHNGRCNALAVDGHIESLLLAPYQPGSPAPTYFIELSDTSGQPAPPSSWPNSVRAKLWFRRIQAVGSQAF